MEVLKSLLRKDFSIVELVNKLGGMDGVCRFLSGEIAVKAVGLLRHVGDVTVSPVSRFIASDHFRTDNTEVEFAWFGGNFKCYFLGKIEKNVEGGTINVATLLKSSLGAPILAELGYRAETTLAHLYELLQKQPGGEAGGPLLINGSANIFYIRGTDGNLWAVNLGWRFSRHSRGWSVGADSVGDPCRWGGVDRVFSRK